MPVIVGNKLGVVNKNYRFLISLVLAVPPSPPRRGKKKKRRGEEKRNTPRNEQT